MDISIFDQKNKSETISILIDRWLMSRMVFHEFISNFSCCILVLGEWKIMTIDTKTPKDCFVSWTKSYKALELVLTIPWSVVVLLVTFMYPSAELT